LAQPDGTVGVYVGGSALVQGAFAEAVQLSVVAGVAQLQWSRDSSAVGVTSGKAGALLSAVNSVIPNWSAQLDGIAAALEAAVNAGHAAGYDLDGNPGVALLSGTTAATIGVSITDPRLIAASSIAPTAGVPSLDGGNADALGALNASTTGPDALYQQLIVSLGIASQSAGSRVSTQSAIVDNLEAARASDSGVSLDEEMTQLLMYQRAYEAASRMVTTVDATLDTLINRMGLVGR